MQWLSLLFPIAYLGILVSSLATFSHLYRQRQVNAKLRLAPYFPPHTARNIYLSLMHLPDQDANTKVPESILRAALLNRAIEDITRIMEIRTRKQALNTLLQRGVVGDEIWQRLLRAEQEMEIELKDVVSEANALAAGWGQSIFQSASEMAQNRMLKARLETIKSTTAKQQQTWNEQREKSRKELEGELEEEKSTEKKEDVKVAEVVAPSEEEKQEQQVQASTTAVEKIVKEVGSDEDGVIVETPALDANASTTASPGASGGGKKNKKKGKKSVS